jgi:DNA (cytosine-5)-methyltransferase 1
MTLTVGSLFSGIGGIDLGLQRAGFKIAWQVEINEYCQKVLAKHWPDVARYGDIRTVGSHNLEAVDLMCGGFPCQDISNAGKRAGITGERSGLWSEFYRLICELRPRYVLVENVAALLVRGIDTVLGDLAACGYDAEWQVLSAAQFGAPHLRERVFLVAYPTSKQGGRIQQRKLQPNLDASSDTSNANFQRLQGFWSQKIQRVEAFSWCKDIRNLEDLRRRPDLPPSLIRGDRHGIPYVVDRLKGLGNAVVPQIAEYIGRCIVASQEANYDPS